MEQKRTNVRDTYENGKRVNRMEVTSIYSKSEDMRSKANAEMQLADLEQQMEILRDKLEQEKLKGGDSYVAKERTLARMEDVESQMRELRLVIDLYENYIKGYDQISSSESQTLTEN